MCDRFIAFKFILTRKQSPFSFCVLCISFVNYPETLAGGYFNMGGVGDSFTAVWNGK